ncbi:MAG: gamma-glutamyltransferase [Clostridiales bacterium]|nr:gamma-glutamyltransferase [Clostridiales bacterium]
MKKIISMILTVMMVLSGCSSYEAVHEREAYGKNGMVSSGSAEASEIGLRILENGGNAIDAAVAVGFAIGVLEPNASGIGGGGFMLIRTAKGETAFIDFREITPLLGDLSQYTILDGEVQSMENQIGPKSIGVPGEVMGLLTALEDYGTMSRKDVLTPAISLATDGIMVSETLASIAQGKFDLIMSDPSMMSIFTSDGLPLMAGDFIKNIELGETLNLISENGIEGFYNSDFTTTLVEGLQDRGSYIQLEDFNTYNVLKSEPVTGSYRGVDIISAPPSSSGGTHVIEILNILENYNLNEMDPYSAKTLHLWSEAYKIAYRDRMLYMADPAFVDVPIEGLTSKAYAKDMAAQITDAVTEFNVLDPWPYESGSTTHYSIIDKEGNMVSVTKTINHFFGSGVMVNGILFNDEIADLSFDPESPNFIEPGKRPLSSMSPTLLLKDGKAFASLGTPGGKRIISTIPWIISQLVDYDKNIQEAIDASRIAQYESGPLYIEGELDESIQVELIQMGHDLYFRKENDLFFGGAQGILILEDGYLHGGADLRRDGYAKGY